jgi:hypothetical protein
MGALHCVSRPAYRVITAIRLVRTGFRYKENYYVLIVHRNSRIDLSGTQQPNITEY